MYKRDNHPIVSNAGNSVMPGRLVSIFEAIKNGHNVAEKRNKARENHMFPALDFAYPNHKLRIFYLEIPLMNRW